MSKILGIYVLLSYPKFSEEFIILMDARKIKLGGGGGNDKNWNSIDFYWGMLTPEQIRYTTT